MESFSVEGAGYVGRGKRDSGTGGGAGECVDVRNELITQSANAF